MATIKTKSLPIPSSSPFDLMKERGFKESNIKKFQDFLSGITKNDVPVPVSLKQNSMSEIMFDDVLDKKVLLYSMDLVWEYENSIMLTLTKDNIGFYASIASSNEYLSCTPNSDI